MSAQQGAARRSGSGSQPGDRRVYRFPGPVVGWWAWVAFAAANLIDVALTGRDWDSVVVVAVIAVITGLVYALAFRPRVIADDDGITVQNPFRDHRIPWGAVNSVVVGDSVLVRCQAEPGSQHEKVVHSWALYAPRRSKFRGGTPGRRRSLLPAATPPPSYAKLPKEAQELLKQSPAQQVAMELDVRASQAKQRGAVGGAWAGSWPWQTCAAVLIPAIALVIVVVGN